MPSPSFSAIVRAVSPASQRRVSNPVRGSSHWTVIRPPDLSMPSHLFVRCQLAASVSPLATNQLLSLAKKGVSGTDVGVVALALAYQVPRGDSGSEFAWSARVSQS